MNLRWSHSALKDFEGCARRYHVIKVLKKYPFPDTEQIRYGKQFHEAAEFYIKEDTPLPEQFMYAKEVLDALKAKSGRKLCEFEMALREDLSPCDWNAEDAWVRGVADLLIVNDDNLTAHVIDYKTGNNKYPDRDQLVLMSLMVFAHFPHIRNVKSALLFVVKNDMVRQAMSREEADAHWWKYRERIARLAACHANDVWNPTQTPLCNWCAVKECEFNPRH